MNLREPNQYTAILDRIASAIWKENEYFPFVPCTDHLGHLFWELIMATSVARKTNKSLVLLKPVTNGYRILNTDVFDCDFNCNQEKRDIAQRLMKMLNFYERHRTSLRRRLLHLAQWFWPIKAAEPVVRFHRCGIEVSNFVMAKVKGTKNYFDLNFLDDVEPSIRLTNSQRGSARQILAGSGFDETSWFVAAHVRESRYRGFEEDHDARNFTQQSLLPIIGRITGRGGFVVRMGTAEQPHIPETKGLFDYARSKIRSSLLDMYIMEKSSFYVGSSSGTLSMAYAFAKPAFIIDYVDFLTAGFRKCDMFIPKMPYDPTEHRFLSISDYCAKATSTWDAKSYWFVENQLDDIDAAFSDFLIYKENGFALKGEDYEICSEWKEIRTRTLKRIILEPARDELGEMFKDVAVSTLPAPAVLAPSFLRKHLFKKNHILQN